MDLNAIQNELIHRTAYTYFRSGQTHSRWKTYANFICNYWQWDAIVEAIKMTVEAYELPKEKFFNYAANRWFDYWSAIAFEHVFMQSPFVIPSLSSNNRLIDVQLQDLEFKPILIEFPKAFAQTYIYCQKHPHEVLTWLYAKSKFKGKSPKATGFLSYFMLKTATTGNSGQKLLL